MSDPSISVETSELNRFAEDVRFEADEGLQPAIDRSRVTLSGVRFGGANAGGGVHAAKARYAQALVRHRANLQAYVEAGQIMAAAAELVAKEFDAVDARSEESVRRIGQMLRTATDEARAKAAEVSGDPTTGPVRAV